MGTRGHAQPSAGSSHGDPAAQDGDSQNTRESVLSHPPLRGAAATAALTSQLRPPSIPGVNNGGNGDGGGGFPAGLEVSPPAGGASHRGVGGPRSGGRKRFPPPSSSSISSSSSVGAAGNNAANSMPAGGRGGSNIDAPPHKKPRGSPVSFALPPVSHGHPAGPRALDEDAVVSPELVLAMFGRASVGSDESRRRLARAVLAHSGVLPANALSGSTASVPRAASVAEIAAARGPRPVFPWCIHVRHPKRMGAAGKHTAAVDTPAASTAMAPPPPPPVMLVGRFEPLGDGRVAFRHSDPAGGSGGVVSCVIAGTLPPHALAAGMLSGTPAALLAFNLLCAKAGQGSDTGVNTGNRTSASMSMSMSASMSTSMSMSASGSVPGTQQQAPSVLLEIDAASIVIPLNPSAAAAATHPQQQQQLQQQQQQQQQRRRQGVPPGRSLPGGVTGTIFAMSTPFSTTHGTRTTTVLHVLAERLPSSGAWPAVAQPVDASAVAGVESHLDPPTVAAVAGPMATVVVAQGTSQSVLQLGARVGERCAFPRATVSKVVVAGLKRTVAVITDDPVESKSGDGVGGDGGFGESGTEVRTVPNWPIQCLPLPIAGCGNPGGGGGIVVVAGAPVVGGVGVADRDVYLPDALPPQCGTVAALADLREHMLACSGLASYEGVVTPPPPVAVSSPDAVSSSPLSSSASSASSSSSSSAAAAAAADMAGPSSMSDSVSSSLQASQQQYATPFLRLDGRLSLILAQKRVPRCVSDGLRPGAVVRVENAHVVMDESGTASVALVCCKYTRVTVLRVAPPMSRPGEAARVATTPAVGLPPNVSVTEPVPVPVGALHPAWGIYPGEIALWMGERLHGIMRRANVDIRAVLGSSSRTEPSAPGANSSRSISGILPAIARMCGMPDPPPAPDPYVCYSHHAAVCPAPLRADGDRWARTVGGPRERRLPDTPGMSQFAALVDAALVDVALDTEDVVGGIRGTRGVRGVAGGVASPMPSAAAAVAAATTTAGGYVSLATPVAPRARGCTGGALGLDARVLTPSQLRNAETFRDPCLLFRLLPERRKSSGSEPGAIGMEVASPGSTGLVVLEDATGAVPATVTGLSPAHWNHWFAVRDFEVVFEGNGGYRGWYVRFDMADALCVLRPEMTPVPRSVSWPVSNPGRLPFVFVATHIRPVAHTLRSGHRVTIEGRVVWSPPPQVSSSSSSRHRDVSSATDTDATPCGYVVHDPRGENCVPPPPGVTLPNCGDAGRPAVVTFRRGAVSLAAAVACGRVYAVTGAEFSGAGGPVVDVRVGAGAVLEQVAVQGLASSSSSSPSSTASASPSASATTKDNGNVCDDSRGNHSVCDCFLPRLVTLADAAALERVSAAVGRVAARAVAQSVTEVLRGIDTQDEKEKERRPGSGAPQQQKQQQQQPTQVSVCGEIIARTLIESGDGGVVPHNKPHGGRVQEALNNPLDRAAIWSTPGAVLGIVLKDLPGCSGRFFTRRRRGRRGRGNPDGEDGDEEVDDEEDEDEDEDHGLLVPTTVVYVDPRGKHLIPRGLIPGARVCFTRVERQIAPTGAAFLSFLGTTCVTLLRGASASVPWNADPLSWAATQSHVTVDSAVESATERFVDPAVGVLSRSHRRTRVTDLAAVLRGLGSGLGDGGSLAAIRGRNRSEHRGVDDSTAAGTHTGGGATDAATATTSTTKHPPAGTTGGSLSALTLGSTLGVHRFLVHVTSVLSVTVRWVCPVCRDRRVADRPCSCDDLLAARGGGELELDGIIASTTTTDANAKTTKTTKTGTGSTRPAVLDVNAVLAVDDGTCVAHAHLRNPTDIRTALGAPRAVWQSILEAAREPGLDVGFDSQSYYPDTAGQPLGCGASTGTGAGTHPATRSLHSLCARGARPPGTVRPLSLVARQRLNPSGSSTTSNTMRGGVWRGRLPTAIAKDHAREKFGRGVASGSVKTKGAEYVTLVAPPPQLEVLSVQVAQAKEEAWRELARIKALDQSRGGCTAPQATVRK